MTEDRCARPIERFGHLSRDHHTTERQIPARDALGEHDEVRRDVEPLNAEPASETTEAADHGVRDKQRAVPAAELLHALQIARSRRVDTARPDHRLHEYRRDALSPDTSERRGKLLERVVVHLSGLVSQLPESVAIGGDARQRGSPSVRSVISVRTADEVLT